MQYLSLEGIRTSKIWNSWVAVIAKIESKNMFNYTAQISTWNIVTVDLKFK